MQVNATLKGYTCPADQGQQCIAPLDNPEYGFNGFDNYGEALLYMMQVRHDHVQAMITSTLVTCTIQSSWCCAPCPLLCLNAYERQSMANVCQRLWSTTSQQSSYHMALASLDHHVGARRRWHCGAPSEACACCG